MPNRITKESIYIRHDYTDKERLEMGTELAQARQREAAIADEEKAVSAGVKERKATVALTVSSLSRKLTDGFDMQNTLCDLKYDDPNVGEVSYYDQGKLVKTRPMTEHERQLDLPLEEEAPKTDAEAEESAEKSVANINEFLGTDVKPEDPPASEEKEDAAKA